VVARAAFTAGHAAMADRPTVGHPIVGRLRVAHPMVDHPVAEEEMVAVMAAVMADQSHLPLDPDLTPKLLTPTLSLTTNQPVLTFPAVFFPFT